MLFAINENIYSLATTILIALAVGLAIALLYIFSNSKTDYTRSLSFTLAVTTVIMAAVSMTIGSNIAVSIGLFGILSILRFRASVKNIKDMAYLLLSVATGLTTGSQNFMLTIFLVASFIAIALLYKILSSSDEDESSDLIFIISGNTELQFPQITAAFKILNISHAIKSSTSNLVSEKQELTLSISNISIDAIGSVTDAIKAIKGVESVSLITPYSTLND